MITIEGYHGTDLECAKKILKNDFTFKYNDSHWLGNGIYFFLDEALAKWWTNKPSKRFGTDVSVGAIIKCNVILKEGHFLDLRNLSHFEFLVETYYTEFLPILKNGAFNKSQLTLPKIRCSYCDFLNEHYDIDVIIGNFSEPEQAYLPFEYATSNSILNLFYIEAQICVFETSNIKNKEIYYVAI